MKPCLTSLRRENVTKLPWTARAIGATSEACAKNFRRSGGVKESFFDFLKDRVS
jgi:hypothetical protein